MAKITIFGLAGTGTTSAGKRLAEIVGYKFLSSGDLFRKKSDELKMDLNEFEKLCLKDSKYDIGLDRKIDKFGRTNDNFVVESRLAYHFIPDSIKVKFTCSYAIRVKRVANRHEIPFSVASEKTNNRESFAAKRYRKLYGIKKLAPNKNFDLIIDTSYKSVEEIVAIIISKFKLSTIV